MAGIVGKMFAGEQKLEKIVSKGNDQEDDVEIMTERPFSQEQMLEERKVFGLIDRQHRFARQSVLLLIKTFLRGRIPLHN